MLYKAKITRTLAYVVSRSSSPTPDRFWWTLSEDEKAKWRKMAKKFLALLETDDA